SLKWEVPLLKNEDKRPYLSINVGGLLITDAEDKRKNYNDPRPTGQHSEIYSRINPGVGPIVGVRAGWTLAESIQIGLSLNTTWLQVDHGWNRFDSYESDKRELKTFLTVGPEARLLREDLTFL
ncbi:MAG: hypothetical protein JSV09_09810, partial [Thermoplasmata archaeon]